MRRNLLKIKTLNVTGAPNTIRTCDPRLRRAVLYPAELWAHTLTEAILTNEWPGDISFNAANPATG